MAEFFNFGFIVVKEVFLWLFRLVFLIVCFNGNFLWLERLNLAFRGHIFDLFPVLDIFISESECKDIGSGLDKVDVNFVFGVEQNGRWETFWSTPEQLSRLSFVVNREGVNQVGDLNEVHVIEDVHCHLHTGTVVLHIVSICKSLDSL